MQLPEFKNEPLSDFKGNPRQFEQMKEAVEKVGKELGRDYDVVIGGRRIKTPEKFCSPNPAHPDQVVGAFSKGNGELAGQAVRTADEVSRPGAGRPPKSAWSCCSRPARSCANGSTFTQRGWCTRWASPGPRPTPTWRRRLTSRSSTRAKCSAWRRRSRSRPSRAKKISCATSRSAWALSSRPGIFHSRFWSA